MTPTRQSSGVGKNSCAMSKSDFSNIASRTFLKSSRLLILKTPLEKAPSGCFRINGKGNLPWSDGQFSSVNTNDFGVRILLVFSSSCKYTLLVHFRMDAGSSMTARPSDSAFFAKRDV